LEGAEVEGYTKKRGTVGEKGGKGQFRIRKSPNCGHRRGKKGSGAL